MSQRSSLAQCRPALGTFVKIQLVGDCPQDDLLEHSLRAFAEIERLQDLMSFHDPESQLSLVNRQAYLYPVTVDPEVMEVLRFALRMSRWTSGVFDCTVGADLVEHKKLPDHGLATDPTASWSDVLLDNGTVFFEKPLLIDLGGIAKGYIVDRALATIPKDIDVVLNAGGDIRMRPWIDRSVSIRVPGPGAPDLVDVPMRAAAVATSGCYLGDEGSMIICPKRRQPLEYSPSISVFAPTCMEADSLTKVALLNPENLLLWRKLSAAPLWIDTRGRLHWLGGPCDV